MIYPKKVAIVGGGVAGMAAAFVLSQHDVAVTLFERESELGGDIYGVKLYSWDGQVHVVDSGVSDFNQSTFHRFSQFLNSLNVDIKIISRDTGFMDENQRLIYFVTDSGKMTFWQEFAQQQLLQSELQRFRQESVEVLENDQFNDFTIQQYLEFRGYSDIFWIYYLRPRALGCFLMHRERLEEFPIRSLVIFLEMHSIVGPTESRRICLTGGIGEYCKKFQEWFLNKGGELQLGVLVQRIERRESGVTIRYTQKGNELKKDFSVVVVATKPNEVLGLIKDPSEPERRAFEQIPFSRDRIVVHTDSRLLPRSKRAWGAYNLTVMQHAPSRVEPTITRWQNNLSVLDSRVPDVFMSMNPRIEPDPHLIIQEKQLIHPVGSFEAMKNSERISNIQGKHHTWFCGSYTQIPFLHETAFNSGASTAEALVKALK